MGLSLVKAIQALHKSLLQAVGKASVNHGQAKIAAALGPAKNVPATVYSHHVNGVY